MYTEYFGLNEKPFSISPDPRYLYLSQRHADALAHLLYGISESGGFIQEGRAIQRSPRLFDLFHTAPASKYTASSREANCN